jgi:DNA-binding CsgD family transcriptional regulator
MQMKAMLMLTRKLQLQSMLQMTVQESNNRIIQLLAAGKIQKEIAAELNLSLRTVEDRILDMKRIYGCTTQTQLVVKLMELNFDETLGCS